LCRK
jgi:hypothetical protein